MSEDIYQALDRTALLLAMDVFGADADHRAIIDGLRATTARILSDRVNLSSPAGQTAVATLYALLAMLGVQIDLDMPDTALVAAQPPFHGDQLPAALLDYSADLLPGGSARPSADPDVTFVLGDTPAPAKAIRVAGTAWTATVGTAMPVPQWHGTGPTGAMAAAAAAAEGLRAAMPRIAEHLGCSAPNQPQWRPTPDRHTEIDLSRYQADGPLALGGVDVISGGAITNAALYVLLRIPAVTAALRIIEPDQLDLPNLNRYALARRSMVGTAKATALKAFACRSIKITAVEDSFNETTAPDLAPLAPHLLVGVDHIPSRWAAQRAGAASWICIGASSHDYVLVSAHPAGSACAGCVHTRDEPAIGNIPTISFVSFWAGLIQALELITHAAGKAPSATRTTHVWPLGLDNPHGIHPFRQDPASGCAVSCPASAMLTPL